MDKRYSDQWYTADGKFYCPEFGMKKAEALYNRFTEIGANFYNKNILDFGCMWGYLGLLCLKHGSKSYSGVDLYPQWEQLEDKSLIKQQGISLFSGHIFDIIDIQDKYFDLIVSAGTLFLLDSEYLDKILDWFYKHLIPGGEVVLSTSCVTDYSFNDLDTSLKVPGAQLLFSKRIINDLLGKQYNKDDLPDHLPYTGATWIMACHCAGFKILNVTRHTNNKVKDYLELHSAKTHWLDRKELDTGVITLHLQKPIQEDELASLQKSQI